MMQVCCWGDEVAPTTNEVSKNLAGLLAAAQKDAREFLFRFAGQKLPNHQNSWPACWGHPKLPNHQNSENQQFWGRGLSPRRALQPRAGREEF
jgi:hypothetical protein